MMFHTEHWTSSSLKDFAFWIASDFTAQIETIMETKPMDNKELADAIDVSPSRVSQVLNNPGNLTLGNTVKFGRGVGYKVALILYNDGDPENKRGPISAAVFEQCWRKLGKPTEMQPESPAEAAILLFKKPAANVATIRFQQAASAGNIGPTEAHSSSSYMEASHARR
jgi:hypothetical protein